MSKISDLVKCCLISDDCLCAEVNFGRVFNAQAQEILKLTGVRLHGIEKVITSYGVRHTIKQHGNDLEERKRGQIGVTNDDFDLLQDILQNPDEVIKGSVERGKQSILFKKKLKGILYNVAMILEGKKADNNLVLRTIYKKPF